LKNVNQQNDIVFDRLGLGPAGLGPACCFGTALIYGVNAFKIVIANRLNKESINKMQLLRDHDKPEKTVEKIVNSSIYKNGIAICLPD
jgi:hypothetical protein